MIVETTLQPERPLSGRASHRRGEDEHVEPEAYLCHPIRAWGVNGDALRRPSDLASTARVWEVKGRRRYLKCLQILAPDRTPRNDLLAEGSDGLQPVPAAGHCPGRSVRASEIHLFCWRTSVDNALESREGLAHFPKIEKLPVLPGPAANTIRCEGNSLRKLWYCDGVVQGLKIG